MNDEQVASLYHELIDGGMKRIRDEDKIAYYSIDDNGVINLWRVNGSFGGLGTDLKWCEENLLPFTEFKNVSV